MVRRHVYGLGLVLTTLAVGAGFAHAYPVYSPSAREAARLKNNPPRGWLSHYLGDDRYKIAGKVWKLVSTPNDTQSYPAWASEMLARPASNVIGFASVEDAVEAGYPPSGKYGSAFPDYTKEGNASPSTGLTTVNRGGKSLRITLADGKSTVELPPNWRRTQSGASTFAGYATKSDVLEPLNGGGSIRISIVPLPREAMLGSTEAERHLTPEAMRDYLQRRGQGIVLNFVNIGAANVGGIRGVLISPKVAGAVKMRDGSPLNSRVALANVGSKVYVIEDKSQKTAGASSIFGSFHPR